MSQSISPGLASHLRAQTSDCGGLAQGTRVLTLAGEQTVETLKAGDRIVTRDAGAKTLRAVTCRVLQDVRMARISPDSLGVGRPGATVLVALDQRILLRDWRAKALYGQAQAMVPVARLIDGQYISEVRFASVSLYELLFDGQHVIYAEGLELASAPATVAA